MGWIKKAPTAVVVAVIAVAGLGGFAVLGGFVLLELQGANTDDYRAFVNTLVNALTLILVGGGTVASVSAARSASNAEDNSNGALTARDERIAALEQENAALRRGGR